MITWKINMVMTQDYYSTTLIWRLTYEIKTGDVHEYFIKDKEIFDFCNYSAKSKYYNDSNRLMVCNMKDEAAGVAIK